MTKSITISLPENDYAHPLYVPGVKRAFIQYDPELQTLHADYSEDDSVLADVYNGEMYEWNISNQILSSDLEVLLNLIKDSLENGTLDPLAIGHTLESGQHDTPELALIAEAADPHNDMGTNGGVTQAYDWVDVEAWLGSQTTEEFCEGLNDDPSDQLREWFDDGDLKQEDSEGNRHVHHDTETTTIIGLLDYWRDRVDEYRAEKATVSHD